MVGVGEDLRFASEPCESMRIGGEGCGQDFQRHVPVQLGIGRPGRRLSFALGVVRRTAGLEVRVVVQRRHCSVVAPDGLGVNRLFLDDHRLDVAAPDEDRDLRLVVFLRRPQPEKSPLDMNVGGRLLALDVAV